MSTPDTMPTTYETKTTTTTSSGGGIGFHPEYLRTIPGILKIVECVLSLITFICAIVWYWWTSHGGGWVQFVSMSAFLSTGILLAFYLLGVYGRLPGPVQIIVLAIITFICATAVFWGSSQGWCQFVSMTAFLSTLLILILHVMNLISRIPGPWLLIEFIYYCVFSVLFLIAAIVAAARGSKHSSIGATAFFAFAATAVYVVDTFFQFRAWRTGQTEMTTTTTATTTTTTSTVETGRTGY